MNCGKHIVFIQEEDPRFASWSISDPLCCPDFDENLTPADLADLHARVSKFNKMDASDARAAVEDIIRTRKWVVESVCSLLSIDEADAWAYVRDFFSLLRKASVQEEDVDINNNTNASQSLTRKFSISLSKYSKPSSAKSTPTTTTTTTATTTTTTTTTTPTTPTTTTTPSLSNKIINSSVIIPYRRRHFEADAMLDEMLQRCGIYTATDTQTSLSVLKAVNRVLIPIVYSETTAVDVVSWLTSSRELLSSNISFLPVTGMCVCVCVCVCVCLFWFFCGIADHDQAYF